MVEPSRFTRFTQGGASSAVRPTRASRKARTTFGVVACTTTLSLAAPLISPAAVGAPASMTELVANISQAQSNIDRLNLNIGDLQEQVNRALVDLQDSRARAEQARRGAEEAKKRLAASEEAVVEARKALDEVTRSQYRGAGQSNNLDFALSGDDQKDVLDRSLYLRQRTEERRAKLEEVERARVEAANDEATQREASEHASATAAEAEAAESEVRALLDSATTELAQEQSQRDAAQSELDAAQAELDQQRAGEHEATNAETDTPAGDQAVAATNDEESGANGETAAPAENQPAHPVAPEQQVTADDVPEDVVVRVEQHAAEIDPAVASLSSETVAQALTTAANANGESLQTAPADDPAEGATEAGNATGMSSNLDISEETIAAAASIVAAAAMVGSSQADHTSLDNPYGGSSNSEIIAAFAGGLSNALGGEAAEVNPTSDSYASPEVSDSLASLLPEVGTAASVSDEVSSAVSTTSSGSIETVISRAQAMIGTPYVWGGGDANGPTTGVDGGSVSGFDCSGLVLYAFAGVGISLPHYTGYQYQRGTQVPASEAKRGDLLFWGPGGNQHVAIYLGDGTMIEAPQAGQNVQIAPVRYSGMAPMAVRLL